MPTTQRKTAAELLGVRAPAKNAKDRLLDKAIDLFYTHGFHVVGLDRIIGETGVTKTTFYKHFECKEDLLLAAIQRRDEWESQAWSRAVARIAGDDPQKKLLAIIDVLDEWFNAPDFGGCIFINAAAEFPDPRDPVHQAAASYKRKTRDHFRDLAQQARLRDPEAFADIYTTLIEGTLILRHVHHRNDAARITRPIIERLITDHLPKSSRRSIPSPA